MIWHCYGCGSELHMPQGGQKIQNNHTLVLSLNPWAEMRALYHILTVSRPHVCDYHVYIPPIRHLLPEAQMLCHFKWQTTEMAAALSLFRPHGCQSDLLTTGPCRELQEIHFKRAELTLSRDSACKVCSPELGSVMRVLLPGGQNSVVVGCGSHKHRWAGPRASF